MAGLIGKMCSWLSLRTRRKPRNLYEALSADPVAPTLPRPEFQPVMSRENAERIVDGLLDLRYLDYVPEAERGEVREQLVRTTHVGHFGTEWFEFENPDGCVASYLKEIWSTLRLENVRLEIAEDRWISTGIDNEVWEGKRYEALINERTYIVFDLSGARADLDTWGLAHKRLVEIINDLLIDAGSPVRAYGVGSHNDAQVMLLTPEQHEYLHNYREFFQRGFFPAPTERMGLLHQDYWPGGEWSGVPPDGNHD